jgi:hypothetical protein
VEFYRHTNMFSWLGTETLLRHTFKLGPMELWEPVLSFRFFVLNPCVRHAINKLPSVSRCALIKGVGRDVYETQ